ncbi:MAG: DUF4180 domain-containing protein [Lachnospiraceae bacterium]
MKVVQLKNEKIAHIQTEEILVTDLQSALDLMATIQFEYECHGMIIHKEAIIEDFFDLSSKLAGEILQKYVNYDMKIAIVGDFSKYTSKALQDFIYECNNGKDVFFASSVEEAEEFLVASK